MPMTTNHILFEKWHFFYDSPHCVTVVASTELILLPVIVMLVGAATSVILKLIIITN